MLDAPSSQLLLQLSEEYAAAGSIKEPSDAAIAMILELGRRQYMPAKSFLVERLHDINSQWRFYCIKALSYFGISNIYDQIGFLLKNDPDTGVRIAAASQLGVTPTDDPWPYWALESAVRSDPSREVRMEAIRALLISAHIPYSAINELQRKFNEGVLQPTWNALEAIIKTSRPDLLTNGSI